MSLLLLFRRLLTGPQPGGVTITHRLAATTAPYDIGDRIIFQAAFVDTADEPTDPTTVTMSLRRRWDEPKIALTPVPDGTGRYRAQYPFSDGQDGTWHIHAAGTGRITAADHEVFYVRPCQ